MHDYLHGVCLDSVNLHWKVGYRRPYIFVSDSVLKVSDLSLVDTEFFGVSTYLFFSRPVTREAKFLCREVGYYEREGRFGSPGRPHWACVRYRCIAAVVVVLFH